MNKKNLSNIMGYFVIPLISVAISMSLIMLLFISFINDGPNMINSGIILTFEAVFAYFTLAIIFESIFAKLAKIDPLMSYRYLFRSPITWVYFFIAIAYGLLPYMN